jgi:hypothetical protein
MLSPSRSSKWTFPMESPHQNLAVRRYSTDISICVTILHSKRSALNITNEWIVVSYSGGPGFKYRSGDRLSWLKFLWFSSVPPGKCRNSALTYATTASFHVPSHLLFTKYPTIRRCIDLLCAIYCVVKYIIGK